MEIIFCKNFKKDCVSFFSQISNFVTSLLNKIDISSELDTATSFWNRRIVESCIYGVDVNPVAVELAKLSLWILAMAKGKPLSFLNHHLKVGNSLIGAKLNQIGHYPGLDENNKVEKQYSLFGDSIRFQTAVNEAIEKYSLIAEKETMTLTDINYKRNLLGEANSLLNYYKRICDLHTDISFGLSISENDYYKYVSMRKLIDDLPQKIPGYFHWELEYPNVFSKGGFDVIIGNPPWVSFGLRGVGAIDEHEEKFFRKVYKDSAEYKLSLYAIFMEAAVRLLADNGRHSFIVPDSFLLGKYFSKIRKFILDTSKIDKIVLFLEDFWPNASIGRCVIYVIEKYFNKKYRDENVLEMHEAKTLQEFNSKKTRYVENKQNNYGNVYLNRFRLYFDQFTKNIVEKMEEDSFPLKDVVKFYSGLIGKGGKASILIPQKPDDYTTEKYGKLISSGKYLKRYQIQFVDEYILREKRLYHSGYDENKYLSPKIFLNQTGDSLKACYDDEGYFCLNNIHIGYPVSNILSLRFMNAILASRLMNFYYHSISLEQGRAMAQIDIETIDLIPLPSNLLELEGDYSGKQSEKFLDYYYNLREVNYIKDNDNLYSMSVRNGFQNSIDFLVHQMLKLKNSSDPKDKIINRRISVTDSFIDSLIYKIYGLSNEEIEFVLNYDM